MTSLACRVEWTGHKVLIGLKHALVMLLNDATQEVFCKIEEEEQHLWT